MPDFWRKELWHPVSVHFPIALLLVATSFLFVSFFCKAEVKKILQNGTLVLLVIGSVAAWISLYTGDLADGIVARKICDPTILKDHEIAAQTATYLFSAAAILNIIIFVRPFTNRINQLSPYIIFILLLIGSAFLIRAGHLGATVVYEQGGGVLNHPRDCDE